MLDAHRIRAHQAQRRLVLRHGLDGAPGEGLGEERQREGEDERNAECDQHPYGMR